MPVQTTYTSERPAAYAGQRANLGLVNITSKVAEDGDIAFGRAVVRGTADNQAKLPTATGQSFMGITEMTTAWSENASDLHVYSQYKEMNIINFGEMYVYTEQSVVPGNDVFFRHTAGTAPLDVVGRFRKDLDTNKADQIIGAKFESTTAAGGIAKISITAPGTGVLLNPDSSETLTAVTSVISVDTGLTYFDTTLGAMAASLADGIEGQKKTLVMMVDGGDVTITPANYNDGTTIVFNEAFESCELLFTDGAWVMQWRKESSLPVITAVTATSGAIALTSDVVTFDTTLGASTSSLADGTEGQEMDLIMIVDGGDQVLTPANLLVGTTLTFNNVGDAVRLRFASGSWNVVSSNDTSLPVITTVTATSGAIALTSDIVLFDSTLGASTSSLADGTEGQRMLFKMIVDGGDQVVTPASFLDGTTITFDNTDACELVFAGAAWNTVGTPTAAI